MIDLTAEVQGLIHAAIERERQARQAEVEALRELVRTLTDKVEVLDEDRRSRLRRAMLVPGRDSE